MSAARPLPAAPPFPTDGRAHPDHPARSDVQLVDVRAPEDEDHFDFGEALELEADRAQPVDAFAPDEEEREILGDVLDLDAAAVEVFGPLDDDAPDTARNPAGWLPPSEVVS